MASDSDDDYMSAAFLAEPAAPPAAKTSRLTYSERRKLKAREAAAKQAPLREQLKESREHGLKRKLDESNKGMQLLKKMGFKDGKGLGKDAAGMAEPLAVSLHAGRTGIGVKTAEDLAVEQEAKRVKLLQEAQGSFRDWRSTRFQEKMLESDIKKCRKICYELDSKQDLLTHTHLWPLSVQPLPETPVSLPLPDPDADTGDTEPVVAPLETIVEDGDEEPGHVELVRPDASDPTADDGPIPRTAEAITFEGLSLDMQLATLIEYLRTTHRYCIYCGCQYDAQDEMDESCPGATRDDH
ncbi:G patch domain-containing protein 11 [Allomyces javanicus]|nr:G patch domain-containing protein 11 [Allomyces javanicus]